MRNGLMGLIASLGIAALCSLSSAANAAYIATDTVPNGELKFYDGSANKDVSFFTGSVGSQHGGSTVNVHTDANIDTGAGFGAIKPASGATLTDVTFTPTNSSQFNSFFFRGQLLADGGVTLKVNDSLGDPTQIFTFDDLKANTNFGPLGIVLDLAFPNDFGAIKSIELISAGFKELKQITFGSTQVAAVPLPASLYLFAAALMILGIMRVLGRHRAGLHASHA
ncbi:MAG TPA: hypothetical protein VN229_05475 [Terriglobales bacterium]|nr:hypothetical protein [Terriglobales bacterium]